jgi:hypothetical protein
MTPKGSNHDALAAADPIKVQQNRIVEEGLGMVTELALARAPGRALLVEEATVEPARLS